jgi:hypothetical protein
VNDSGKHSSLFRYNNNIVAVKSFIVQALGKLVCSWVLNTSGSIP